MNSKPQNTFFTKEQFDNDIELGVNEDVLKRLHDDGIKPGDKLPISFFFVTDTEAKAEAFRDHLTNNFPDYTELEVWDYEDDFEIRGFTGPILMNLKAINQWNQTMWDIGYAYDCILDGWEVEGT